MNTRHRMNGGSEEIKANIEETRANMDDTLDALSERLRPRHLLDDFLDYWHERRQARAARGAGAGDGEGRRRMKRAASRVGHSAGDAGKMVWQQVQAHPVPALLIGAGVAWLFMENNREEYEVEEIHGEYLEDEFGYENGPGPEAYALPAHYAEEGSTGGTLNKMKEKGSKMASKAGEGWRRMRERTSQGTANLRHRASERSMQLREQARRGYNQGVEKFRYTSHEYPLAVGAGCLALGVLAGMLLPSTRKEDEWMGPARDKVVNRSREAAQEAIDRGKHVVQTAADVAKSEMQSQGLTPEALKSKVQTAATNVRNATREEAERETREMKQHV